MVKAYLRYVQEKVLGGLVGNLSNMKIIQIRKSPTDPKKTTYVITACNEVVNFTNTRTGEVELRIYDKDALYGQVT